MCVVAASVFGQGETTSAILGQVTDATNAAIPELHVTITNRETGLRRAVSTDEEGRFNFPQLPPGTYAVEVEAPGFEKQRTDNVVSSLGQKQTVNFTLKLAQSQQAIEVSGEAPLINPGNANTSTTLDAPALENLPNPGGDLTYPLQFAAGALMNTAGSGNDFVGGTQRVRQRGIQRPARSLERLHRGRTGDQRSAHEPQQRAFDQSRAGAEFDLRSDREYAVLFGGSGKVWRVAGQLRHQIRKQSVSRESLRDLERSGAECGGLFHQCHGGEPRSRGPT